MGALFEEVSDKVPESNLIQANPEVIGPIFLNLQFAGEESIRAEMFLNLLARSIDKERVTQAHPAYGHIISQLHPDEAVILYELKKRNFPLVEKADLFDGSSFRPREEVSNDFPLCHLSFQSSFRSYIDHLYHLGLAWITQHGPQERVFDANGQMTGVVIKSQTSLMSFGQQFAKACVPDEFNLKTSSR